MSKNIIFTFLAVIMAVGFVSGGCQSTTHSKEQQIRKYSRVSGLQSMMLADDIERMLLLDRPSRLSQWHVVAER